MSNSYTKEYTPELSTDGLYDPSFEHEACGVGLGSQHQRREVSQASSSKAWKC